MGCLIVAVLSILTDVKQMKKRVKYKIQKLVSIILITIYETNMYFFIIFVFIKYNFEHSSLKVFTFSYLNS